MPEERTMGNSGFPLSETVDADREFDQELGKRMGTDAQKVADGEMSEAEFFEKYHDDVVDEFGDDARPLNANDDYE